ncbi:hypothetical protein NTGZN8_50071 [Candidatus Nitrotoga fabula]|uniref:Uncharacterized protein n=1 Tax=Candidatus Nitrotoga fabula TaxID=2182327 RepID=A0A916BDE4_9PROT|nr:hypothetical protein NTGZN8_50071 [Candidatus Nitrotoga fabula]
MPGCRVSVVAQPEMELRIKIKTENKVEYFIYYLKYMALRHSLNYAPNKKILHDIIKCNSISCRNTP